MSRAWIVLALLGTKCTHNMPQLVCATTREPMPHRDTLYACRDELAAHAIDTERENRAALDAWYTSSACHGSIDADVIVVPGYVPLNQPRAVSGVHPIALERLLRALLEWRNGAASFIMVSGGNVHPDATPYNEALEMKHALLVLGAPERAIIIEPCARHSHTNLRNAGRMMLALGMRRGLIVTSYDQGAYFSGGASTSFTTRARADLGYAVGHVRGDSPLRLFFLPSPKVVRSGPDPHDP